MSTSTVRGTGLSVGGLPAQSRDPSPAPQTAPGDAAGGLEVRQVREVRPGPVADPPIPLAASSAQACATRLEQREVRLVEAPEPYLRALDPGMSALLTSVEEGETERDVNLNCKARFTDSDEEIACRHLAIAVWRARSTYLQARQAGEPTGRFSYSGFATTERLQATVDSSTDTLYEAIAARSGRSHLVLASRWGAFLEDQFKTLKPGEHRHLLVVSVNHVMLAELQVKQKEGQSPYRVVMFYDPNQTLTHQRLVLDESSTRACTLGTFLEEDDLADYFPSDPAERLARVIELDPADLGDSPSPEASRADTKSQPASVTHAGPQCSVAELQLRISDNLNAGLAQRLVQTLAGCNRQQALDLLLARDRNGTPGLVTAMQQGNTETARILVEAALSPRLGLQDQDLAQFLTWPAGDGKSEGSAPSAPAAAKSAAGFHAMLEVLAEFTLPDTGTGGRHVGALAQAK